MSLLALTVADTRVCISLYHLSINQLRFVPMTLWTGQGIVCEGVVSYVIGLCLRHQSSATPKCGLSTTSLISKHSISADLFFPSW